MDTPEGTTAEPAKELVTVRPATVSDVLILKVLLKQSWMEVQEGQFSRINDAKLREYVQAMIGHPCFVAIVEDCIIGTLCLRPLQEIWSDDDFLNEEWFYVLPKFRSTGAAEKLLDTAERLADTMGLPVFFAINNHNPEPVDRLIRKREGYRYTGGNFMRRPHGQQENIDGHEA